MKTLSTKSHFEIGSKIKFEKTQDKFYEELKSEVKDYFSKNNLNRFANTSMWLKIPLF